MSLSSLKNMEKSPIIKYNDLGYVSFEVLDYVLFYIWMFEL